MATTENSTRPSKLQLAITGLIIPALGIACFSMAALYCFGAADFVYHAIEHSNVVESALHTVTTS